MRPKFPIIQDGGILCEYCGRICFDNFADYFCNACDRKIPACTGCFPAMYHPKHLGIRHDRDCHWPLYSIDIA